MKFTLRPVLLFGLIVCLAVGTAYAVQKVADTFMIDHRSEFPKSIRQPVEFTHAKHVDDHQVACHECHHIYEDGKNIWTMEGWETGKQPVQKCMECHPADRQAAQEKNVDDLRNAFHKNCQGCHKEVNKEGKTAPMKCNECHVG